MRSPGIHRWVWLALLVVLTGCKVTVQTKAPEAQANEVLSVLLNAGIDAEKVPLEEQFFDVAVDRDKLRASLEILKAQGLPRDRHASLGEIFRKEGLVSTPAEERVRYIYGVSQELERTISQIDGVVIARVHVVIPANDPLADLKTPSSASVFVKHRVAADPNTLGPLVRSLVVRGIEGLDGEHVSVAFSLARPAEVSMPHLASLMGMEVEAGARPWLAGLLFLPWVLLVASVAFFVMRHKQAVRDEVRRVRHKLEGLRSSKSDSSLPNRHTR